VLIRCHRNLFVCDHYLVMDLHATILIHYYRVRPETEFNLKQLTSNIWTLSNLLSCWMSNVSNILSHILITQQVINGFSGLMIRFIGQSPDGSTDTLQKVTGTITHEVFNNSTLRCSLYESGEQVCTQSPLFCLVLGFYYSVGLSSIYSCSVSPPEVGFSRTV
jgi:hypothetical protein